MEESLVTKISDKFGQSVIKGSMIASENYLADLLNIVCPRTILEIGTLRGCSAALFAKYAEKVITIDLETAPEENRILAKNIWSYLTITIQIQSFVVQDNEEKKMVVSNQRFDLAFIDGGHKYSDVEFDFSCVKNCGLIIFHDYKPTTNVYNDCNNKRYEAIVQFVSSLIPPAFVWGPHCKQFALWVNHSHILRSNRLFTSWGATNLMEIS